MKLAGWGRFPVIDCAAVTAPRDDGQVLDAMAQGDVIARGNGRGYGDCAANPRATLAMRHRNRMLAFDETSGQLVAEAGVLLADVISTFLPRGWFPTVTPGTRFVTLGGMLAADVHGKNHHRDGSCRATVDWFDLACRDGVIRRCSRAEHPELFDWTIGGMGLTGIILRVAMRLRPVGSGWIRQTMIPAPDLDSAMAVFEASQEATYSVAWIDCLARGTRLGRSLVSLGEHAEPTDLTPEQRAQPFDVPAKRARSVPIDAPSFALNPLSVRAFNQLYYWNGTRKKGDSLVPWDSYFYPLDAIGHWNRIYGRRGFAQFQCALPLERSRDGLRALLDAIARTGNGSFLAVLKRFGAQDGPFSFPMPGYTLALDFPMSRRTRQLLDRLDRIVIDHGGRFYLAKDSRMSAQTLRESDNRAVTFRAYREATGMNAGFRSAQSERLEI